MLILAQPMVSPFMVMDMVMSMKKTMKRVMPVMRVKEYLLIPIQKLLTLKVHLTLMAA